MVVFQSFMADQHILTILRNLCDMNQEGKLNPEQFALAMWLINRKQAGKDPPAALTPDMVPPSLRPKGQDAVRYLGLTRVLFYCAYNIFHRYNMFFD